MVWFFDGLISLSRDNDGKHDFFAFYVKSTNRHRELLRHWGNWGWEYDQNKAEKSRYDLILVLVTQINIHQIVI